jgi:hypothetical protein
MGMKWSSDEFSEGRRQTLLARAHDAWAMLIGRMETENVLEGISADHLRNLGEFEVRPTNHFVAVLTSFWCSIWMTYSFSAGMK